MQTDKLSKKIEIILYGREYWDQILDLKPMVEWGAIAEKDVELLTLLRHAGRGLRAAAGASRRAPPRAADRAGGRRAGNRQDARVNLTFVCSGVALQLISSQPSALSHQLQLAPFALSKTKRLT